METNVVMEESMERVAEEDTRARLVIVIPRHSFRQHQQQHGSSSSSNNSSSLAVKRLKNLVTCACPCTLYAHNAPHSPRS